MGALRFLPLALLGAVLTTPGRADETCQSPYLPKITGQEDYVYVWTLGMEGVGDGSDKLVTVGTNPARSDYGKVVSVASVGGRHEAHDLQLLPKSRRAHPQRAGARWQQPG